MTDGEEIKIAAPPPLKRRRRRRKTKKKKAMDIQEQPEDRKEVVETLETLPLETQTAEAETENEIEKLRQENEKMRAEFAEIRKQLSEKRQETPAKGTISDIQAARSLLQQIDFAMGVKPKAEPVTPFHPKDIEDPLQGDKTPAVVEWYKANAPEEYKRRYSGRKTHMEDRRGERPYEPLPGGVGPPAMPADPDGKYKIGDKELDLKSTDDSGSSPRNTADI